MRTLTIPDRPNACCDSTGLDAEGVAAVVVRMPPDERDALLHGHLSTDTPTVVDERLDRWAGIAHAYDVPCGDCLARCAHEYPTIRVVVGFALALRGWAGPRPSAVVARDAVLV